MRPVWRVRVERYKGKRVPVTSIDGGAESYLTRCRTEETFNVWPADELAMEEEMESC